MSVLHIDKIYRKLKQQGKVSLQNIFWVVGIIVGLLSIAQFALTYLNSRSDENLNGTTISAVTSEIDDVTELSDSVDEADSFGSSTSIVEQKLFDSPSIKVDNYTAYENGIAVDEELGIMWMRCSLGQDWNGSKCVGSAEVYSMEEAQRALEELNTVSYVGLYEWQLPDIEALHSLVFCSEGYAESVQIPLTSGRRKNVDASCTGDYIKPTIRGSVFPNTQWALWRAYWSSSKNDEDLPLTVDFNTGDIETNNKTNYIRAMRYTDSK